MGVGGKKRGLLCVRNVVYSGAGDALLSLKCCDHPQMNSQRAWKGLSYWVEPMRFVRYLQGRQNGIDQNDASSGIDGHHGAFHGMITAVGPACNPSKPTVTQRATDLVKRNCQSAFLPALFAAFHLALSAAAIRARPAGDIALLRLRGAAALSFAALLDAQRLRAPARILASPCALIR